jgi:uncharacterized protein YjbJ (UPF0337 family)
MPRGKKDEIEGELEDVQGRMGRQTGEWTDDKEAQARGAAQQAKGKAKKAIGKLKNQADRLQSPIKKKAA